MPSTARAVEVGPGDDGFDVHLNDGRRHWIPYSWFPRLDSATATQRANWVLIGSGIGIHWPDVDEDLSIEGLLKGQAAPPGSASFRAG